MTSTPQPASRPVALLPFALFLALFLGSGIYFSLQGNDNAFYELHAPIAVLPALLLAVLLQKGRKQQAVTEMIHGMGHPNIITMCVIYLLAGAFSTVASATGAVDATVQLGLTLVPPPLILPGIFFLSAFISTAMGTSMGTITAVMPAASGIGQHTDINSAWLAGAVLSGAMFGDNLSFISDTTIAATKTQGCAMRDKFWENLRLAIPAALLTAICFFFLQGHSQHHLTAHADNAIQALPYLTILVLAALGLDVFLVLVIGIVFSGALGLFLLSDYTLLTFTDNIYDGFTKMQEIFLLSLLIGGLGQIIREQGGLHALTNVISKWVASSKKSASPERAEFAIGGMVGVTNTCIANNTVAIILTGDIAHDIANEHKVSRRRSASMLDIFSCISQGLLPWGAQILLLGSHFALSPLTIMTHSLYVMLLAAVTVITLIYRNVRARRSPSSATS